MFSSLEGRNCAIVIAELLARVIAAIRIASVRWRSYSPPPKHSDSNRAIGVRSFNIRSTWNCGMACKTWLRSLNASDRLAILPIKVFISRGILVRTSTTRSPNVHDTRGLRKTSVRRISSLFSFPFQWRLQTMGDGGLYGKGSLMTIVGMLPSRKQGFTN